MSTELIAFVFEKLKVPNAIKTGLIISVIVFKGFDIENRVKRAMHSKPAS